MKLGRAFVKDADAQLQVQLVADFDLAQRVK